MLCYYCYSSGLLYIASHSGINVGSSASKVKSKARIIKLAACMSGWT